MRYIYGDVFFVVNFAVNYILLYITAFLTRLRTTAVYLAGGALLGTVYALGFLVPGRSALYAPLLVLLFPAIMVWIALRPRDTATFVRAFAVFYAAALMVAGAEFALASLKQNVGSWSGGGQRLVFPPWAYAVAAAAALAIAAYLRATIRRHEQLLDRLVTVEARLRGRTLSYRALVDTGLLLVEPLTGAPVVLVDQGVIRRFVPELAAAVQGHEQVGLAAVGSPPGSRALATRLRFIPFDSVGKRHGVLPGVALDSLTIIDGEERRTLRVPVTLAWTPQLAAMDGSYEGLIGPEVYENRNGRENFA